MELWDAYDKDFNKIDGMTLVRGERMPDGVYHLVCEILVQHKDGTYLLMKRDSCKAYGGMWEASGGGSALQGEDPLQGAFRELREETGIVADELTEIRRDINTRTKSVYVNFLCITDIDKDAIKLQKGETVDYRWVTKEELLKMPATKLLTPRTIEMLK